MTEESSRIFATGSAVILIVIGAVSLLLFRTHDNVLMHLVFVLPALYFISLRIRGIWKESSMWILNAGFLGDMVYSTWFENNIMKSNIDPLFAFIEAMAVITLLCVYIHLFKQEWNTKVFKQMKLMEFSI